MKYFRRSDIDAETRLNIAILVYLHKGVYGYVVNLAAQFGVCRKFIYEQVNIFQLVFALETTRLPDPASVTFQSDHFISQMILLLRLEGNCSITQIHNILSGFGLSPNSAGMICQRLQSYAAKLPSTLSSDTVQMVLYLSDELFANSVPILITIEPRSTAILRIELATNRQAETWQQHWSVIEQNQFYTLGLCSDRGTGLQAGFAALDPEAPHNFDLFHDFRDLSHACLVHLEKKAYKAIAYEYERERVIDSARSDRTITTRINAYEEAAQQTQRAIEQYDQAAKRFRRIQKTLDVFDRAGQCKKRSNVEQELTQLLEQLAELGDENLTQAAQQLIDQLPSMLGYFDQANQIVAQLKTVVHNPNVRQALCLAWQWHNKSFQAKTTTQKKHARYERDFWLFYVKEQVGDCFEAIKKQAFDLLDSIVRSSSLIEMVNSLIRPFLNTCKGQITQKTLNLIMFYHNHRRFNTGKRKNIAPIELLTNVKLEKHWSELLMAA